MQLRSILLLAAAVATLSGCVVVEDGTVGVSKSFGRIAETALQPGPYMHIPVMREVEVWNIKTQRRSLILSIPSGEGLIIKLQATVLYRPTEVVRLRTEVGTDFVETVLDSTMINTFREVIGQQRVEELITNQEKMTGLAATKLERSLGERGILVEDLMLTGLELPEKFKDAIERKLEQEQRALQKRFELDQAEKDAEIEVAAARGTAKAQEIIRETLTAEYLQYMWIKTLNQNPNVIYVATEANMPVFRTMDDLDIQNQKKPASSAKGNS